MVKYELKKEYDEGLCGGKGKAIFHRCLEESEFYYFLEGTGTYDDNGKGEYEIKPGMVTMTYDGEGHALANTGDTPMKFMAVIIKE